MNRVCPDRIETQNWVRDFLIFWNTSHVLEILTSIPSDSGVGLHPSLSSSRNYTTLSQMDEQTAYEVYLVDVQCRRV